MRAEDVGWSNNKMVLGKHSGRNAFKARLEELGIMLADETDFQDAFKRFKALADKKHDIFDADLHALVSDTQRQQDAEVYELKDLKVCSEMGETPVAQISITVEGKPSQGSSAGSGPVDATFKAIESIVQSDTVLELYSVNAITSGTDSQGEVTVRLKKEGRVFNGQGADTDIVVASAKAYLDALNLTLMGAKPHPQTDGV
jgi:2-isopropylmalate synthase